MAVRIRPWAPFYLNMSMQDKRFFQLIFTPFLSNVISGDIDQKINTEIMLQRLKEMPDKLRRDLVAGLEVELKVSAIKLRSLPSNLKALYQKKIDAIQEILDLLPAYLER